MKFFSTPMINLLDSMNLVGFLWKVYRVLSHLASFGSLIFSGRSTPSIFSGEFAGSFRNRTPPPGRVLGTHNGRVQTTSP